MKEGMIGKNKHDLVYRPEPCIVKIDEEHIQYTLENIDDLIEVLKQIEELRVVR